MVDEEEELELRRFREREGKQNSSGNIGMDGRLDLSWLESKKGKVSGGEDASSEGKPTVSFSTQHPENKKPRPSHLRLF